MAAWHADHDGIENFSGLVSHVLVPPAMEAMLSSENCVVQGFLAAGHVCTIMGFAECYKVPIVVTGFEPLDILEGILMTATQLEEGRHRVAILCVREGLPS
jgi:hydrogenase expression/formation protein HypD